MKDNATSHVGDAARDASDPDRSIGPSERAGSRRAGVMSRAVVDEIGQELFPARASVWPRRGVGVGVCAGERCAAGVRHAFPFRRARFVSFSHQRVGSRLLHLEASGSVRSGPTKPPLWRDPGPHGRRAAAADRRLPAAPNQPTLGMATTTEKCRRRRPRRRVAPPVLLCGATRCRRSAGVPSSGTREPWTSTVWSSGRSLDR